MFGISNLRATPLQVWHVAAHIDAMEATLLPALASGTWVVLDRYWWSTWVYGLLSGMDRGVLEALIEVERRCWGSTLPSLVALIELRSALAPRGSEREVVSPRGGIS